MRSQTAERVYGALCRLLPAALRHEAESDLLAVFRAEYARVCRRPRRARVGFWFRVATDILVTAVAERAATRRSHQQHELRRPHMWFFSAFAGLGRDIRVALRQFVKAPGFTALAVLTLALGLGATTAVFSLVNGVLLRPLPYQDPARLLTIWEKNPDGTPDFIGFATYRDWSAQSRTFASIALYSSWQPTLQVGEPEELNGLRVTNNYFRTLGVQLALGRDFLPSEDTPATNKVVILSHDLWVRRFNADPAIVGHTIAMNATSYLVAGILPASYQSLMNQDPRSGAVEIWRVLGYDVSQSWACRSCHHLVALGRLAPGVAPTQAQAEMDTISAVLFHAYPKDYATPGVILTPVRDHLLGAASTPLEILFGAVACVLLVACANLANLLLARATRREQELAVRTALGAGRGRLARQILTENVVLASVGAAVGLLPAYWTPRIVAAVGTGDLPRLTGVTLDVRVVGFAVGAAVFTGVLAGLAPIYRLWQADLRESLHGSRGTANRASRRLQSLLVIAEVAVSLTLLVGAGLLLRSLSRLIAVSPGFETNQVLTLRTSLLGTRYQDNAVVRQYFADTTDRLRQLPGVEAAAAASEIPLGGNIDRYGLHPEGKMHANPELDDSAERYCVTPGYLAALRIPLLRGRDITAEDGPTAPDVLLVSATTARRIWPGEDALGKRVKVGGLDHPWLTVVGIVGDVHHEGLDIAPTLQMYIPHAQWPFPDTNMTFVIRTSGPPSALAAAAEAAIHAIDPTQPLSHVLLLEDYVGLSIQGRRFALLLIGAFSAIALLLSVIGIYSVTAYQVAQRGREIAIRMSLGARRRAVLALFVRQSMALAAMGAGLGILASLLLARVLTSLLFDLAPTDPLTFGSVTLLMLGIVAVASWLPARRAMRVDPIVALRAD